MLILLTPKGNLNLIKVKKKKNDMSLATRSARPVDTNSHLDTGN